MISPGRTMLQLTDAALAEVAGRLADAERDRVAIEPPSSMHPDLALDDAYAIQRINIERRVERGSCVRGHKIGLTAKVMQELFGVNEPDYGHLMDDMFEYEASTVSLDRFISPRVEVEPAFVLGRRLEGPGITAADVVRATECVMPAIEIIDSRVADWNIKLVDTVADNGSSGGVVLGGRPVSLTSFDPRTVFAQLLVDGRVVEYGSTAGILGNPVTSVAWLANALSRFEVALEAGHVVLPGTCVRAVPVAAGNSFTGRFGVLGDVEVEFA
jgi:2-keto-4-pentenoate hydratase